MTWKYKTLKILRIFKGFVLKKDSHDDDELEVGLIPNGLLLQRFDHLPGSGGVCHDHLALAAGVAAGAPDQKPAFLSSSSMARRRGYACRHSSARPLAFSLPPL